MSKRTDGDFRMTAASGFSRTLYQSFSVFAADHRLIEPGERALAACSGGVDSSVLLDLLVLYAADHGVDVIPAYFNHRLRGGESEREEAFMREKATAYGLRLLVGSGDVKREMRERGISLQEAARNLRYAFLEETAEQTGAVRIATAHHADDQVETVLAAFLTGAGLNGLRGIPLRRGKIVRPLLHVKRADIERYARERAIAFFEDSTNAGTAYLRNRIRHVILPVLREQVDQDIDAVLAGHGDRFAKTASALDLCTADYLSRCLIEREKYKIVLDIRRFKNYFTLLQQNILSECFTALGQGDKQRFGEMSERAIAVIAGTKKRGSLYISNTVVIEKDYEKCVIARMDRYNKYIDYIPGETYRSDDPAFTVESRVFSAEDVSVNDKTAGGETWDEFVDMEKLTGPLRLRFRKRGDRFCPLGMQSEKKLSDFFIDEKVPRYERPRIPVLEDAGTIVYVCGLRIDDRVKLTERSGRIAGFRYNQNRPE